MWKHAIVGHRDIQQMYASTSTSEMVAMYSMSYKKIDMFGTVCSLSPTCAAHLSEVLWAVHRAEYCCTTHDMSGRDVCMSAILLKKHSDPKRHNVYNILYVYIKYIYTGVNLPLLGTLHPCAMP